MNRLLLVVALLLAVLPVGTASAAVEIDPAFAALDAAASATAIATFDHRPSPAEVALVKAAGLQVHTFQALPMVAVRGPKASLQRLTGMAGLVSLHLDKPLEYWLDDSRRFISADRAASQLGVNGAGVGVAVIDSGVDATHPDLAFGTVTVQNVKIVAENLFTAEPVILENQPNTDTSSGHGTHVAGTIAGRGTASSGRYVGIAPGAHLVGIGVGDVSSILWSIQGYDYAIANKEKYRIRVISNSWGPLGGGGDFTPGNPVNVASRTAYQNGIVSVFAAGNDGPAEGTTNVYSVAPWVIGVAAGCTHNTGVQDTSVRCPNGTYLADFSSRGRPSDPAYNPTITAPGVWIEATRAKSGAYINAATAGLNAFCQPADLVNYTCANGTSMATPHVSGVVAMILQARPELPLDLVKEAIRSTGTPMTRPDGTPHAAWEVGGGYVNALKAVEKAKRMKIKRPGGGGPGQQYETYTETFEWSGTVGPGLQPAGAASHDYFEQAVGANALRAVVRIEWTTPQDLDLHVFAPDGTEVGNSGNPPGVTNEETTLDANLLGAQFLPAGTYKVDAEGFATVAESYRGRFEIEYAIR
jgi:serine protease AprX